MKRVYNQVVERLISKQGLDRRKRYSVYAEFLCTTGGKFTRPCSGCSCDTEYACSCCQERGAGCSDCGYTGKSVTYFPSPVIIDTENHTYECDQNGPDTQHYQAMPIASLLEFLAENAAEIKLPLSLINACIPKAISCEEGDIR